MSIGSQIAKLRAKKGWTQAELAERLEMHAQHIYRLEKDHFHPRPKTLLKLAEVLGVGPDLFTAVADKSTSAVVQNVDDKELSELMAQVPVLDTDKRNALKTFLQALLTCQQVQSIAGGNFRSSLVA